MIFCEAEIIARANIQERRDLESLCTLLDRVLVGAGRGCQANGKTVAAEFHRCTHILQGDAELNVVAVFVGTGNILDAGVNRDATSTYVGDVLVDDLQVEATVDRVGEYLCIRKPDVDILRTVVTDITFRLFGRRNRNIAEIKRNDGQSDDAGFACFCVMPNAFSAIPLPPGTWYGQRWPPSSW